ncbi:MAG: TetR/AcrR family transcriptional regulator [Candidatus Brocadiia bacterium]
MSDAGPALSRRERERRRHRREILAAAERVFAAKGFHGATVEEIAQDAEFAVGTLYNFFGSKEQLYEEVAAGLAEQFIARFRRQVAGADDPVEAIGALIELRLTFFDEHQAFARVFFESVLGGHIDLVEALPERCAPLFEEGMATIRAIFARGVREGRFVDLDPLYLTLCLHGVVNAFLAYWSRQGAEEPLEERVAKLRGIFLDRFCRGGA